MKGFSISIEQPDIHAVVVVKLEGNIDVGAAGLLESYLRVLMEKNYKIIVADCSMVTFLSSSGIGVLMGNGFRLRERGCSLVFMGLPQPIRSVFDIIDASRLFREIDNVEELRNELQAR
jgi:anti-sigma B factor antagonist